MKNPNEIRLINIITRTLIMPSLSERLIVPRSGLIRPIIKMNVKTVAALITLFFPSQIPLLSSNSTIPTNTGIRAVTDGLSETKYPKRPRMIKIRAFKRLTIAEDMALILCSNN